LTKSCTTPALLALGLLFLPHPTLADLHCPPVDKEDIKAASTDSFYADFKLPHNNAEITWRGRFDTDTQGPLIKQHVFPPSSSTPNQILGCPYKVVFENHREEFILPLGVREIDGARKPMPTVEEVRGYIAQFKNRIHADVPSGSVTWKVNNITMPIPDQGLSNVQEQTPGHISVSNGKFIASYILTFDKGGTGSLTITLPSTLPNVEAVTQ